MPTVGDILKWATTKPPGDDPKKTLPQQVIQLRKENHDLREELHKFIFEETAVKIMIRDTSIQYSLWRKEVKLTRKQKKELELELGKAYKRILKLKDANKKQAKKIHKLKKRRKKNETRTNK